MTIRNLKRCILILAAGLLAGCGGEFNPRQAEGLFSADRATAATALDCCIRHRSAAERFLIERYTRESRADRGRIAWYLGVVGGPATVDFLCRQLLARPVREGEELLDHLDGLGYSTLDYDLGLTLIDPPNEETGYQHPRVLILSATTVTFLLAVMDVLEQRERQMNRAGEDPMMDVFVARRIARIRMNVAALPVYR